MLKFREEGEVEGGWGGQWFNAPGGPMLGRKSSVEMDEVQFGEEHRSHWCMVTWSDPFRKTTTHAACC